MSTELGQAYIQILPSAKGIKGNLESALGGEAASAGGAAGGKFSGAFKKVIAGAAIGAALKKTIGEGAALEQSLGGIDTLFKGSADKVKKYASEAYKTAGVSANTYMETVTSFSASLLQSLGGDTAKAADKANMAMVDMSDNANKMGTNMVDIQNAYQGFAKQNYTMLDNLKLGYGGTQEEMQRLLSDAEKISGQKYDMSNLSDVYSAIHVIQGELDITGTTAKEAATTLSGSFESMKAAFSDVLGNLTLGNDITPSLNALVETASTYLFRNLLPAVGNIFKALPGAIGTLLTSGIPILIQEGVKLLSALVGGIQEGIPAVMSGLSSTINAIVTGIETALPRFVEAGGWMISNISAGIQQNFPTIIGEIGSALQQIVGAVIALAPQLLGAAATLVDNLATAFVTNFPTIINSFLGLITNIINTILSSAPQLLAAAGQLIWNLATGFAANIPTILSGIGSVILSVIGALAGSAPQLIASGGQLIGSLITGLVGALPDLLAGLGGMLAQLVPAIIEFVPQLLAAGGRLIVALGKGIVNAANSIFDAIGGIMTSVGGAIDGFGSKIMSLGGDLIGKLASGVRNAASTAWNAAKGVAEKLLSPITTVRDKIKGIVDKIKGFFNFKFKMPKIPVPKFQISPSGWKVSDLLHGSIPYLNIRWAAKGGVFSGPSVIGVGEAGPEAVVPLAALWSKFDAMADSIVGGVGTVIAGAGAGNAGPINITLYMWPNGPKAGEWVVKSYDEYKRKLG